MTVAQREWTEPFDQMAARRRQGACIVDGCGKVAEKRHLCGMHYRRQRVHGDVNFRVKPGNGEVSAYINDVVMLYKGDDCLVWPFCRTPMGYAAGPKGLTTRYVCELAHGKPPTPRHEAAHTCGNGAGGCVTVGHLVWKTRKENEADKLLHGTSNRGERSGNAKLTNDQAREIKRLSGTQTNASLARRFGVSKTTIIEIRLGRRWAWLSEGGTQ